ncbi:MAG: ArsR family transcriptional regulator [Bradyrhizobium sp.]|nr:MAG: ArsR family transcriptional regulator [Bradyrhizobium sp.]
MPRRKASADVYHAIADPTRRAILDKLRTGSAPVNAILEGFSQSRPAISKHLRVLREAQVVVEKRVGRERVYSIRPAKLQQISSWLESYRRFWETSLKNLKGYLESEG